MKKQTKVLLAAAMLTLGASFSALAAEKGTWVLESDGWYCYDADGDAWTEEFCLSYGTEYYVDEDGLLASSMWVEGENNDMFYVQSNGSKTVNAWKYVLPFEAEDDEEEAWFWFDAKGRMAANKRVLIGENYYYFDEDGKMLTGWVEVTKNAAGEITAVDAADQYTNPADVIYATETGARGANQWLNTVTWGVEIDDAEEDDFHWYWIGSTGKVTTGKKDIEDLTYFFDVNGEMQTGWVGYDATSKTYETTNTASVDALYFVGEQGYAKKNGWRKLVNAATYANRDEDSSTYWFYFDKNGKAYLPTETTTANSVSFVNGDLGTFTTTDSNAAVKKIDGVEYLFGANGQLVTGIKEMADGNRYYFTANGRVFGNTSIKDADDYAYEFYFAEKATEELVKGQAVSGNADGYLYVNGLLQTSEEKGLYKIVEVNGDEFIVNNAGKIQHREGKKYALENGTTIKANTFEDTKGLAENSVVNYETVTE